MNVSITEVLAILGALYVEKDLLARRVAELEAELARRDAEAQPDEG